MYHIQGSKVETGCFQAMGQLHSTAQPHLGDFVVHPELLGAFVACAAREDGLLVQFGPLGVDVHVAFESKL
jgi:hypothetical protein